MQLQPFALKVVFRTRNSFLHADPFADQNAHVVNVGMVDHRVTFW